MSIPAPHWDLSNVYPSLDSQEFKSAIEDFKHQVGELEEYFVEVVSKTDARTPPGELAPILGDVVDRFNAAYTLSATIEPFIYSFVSTDSRDKTAMRSLSEYEQVKLPLQNLDVQLKGWLGKVAPILEQALLLNDSAKAHAFMLREAADQSQYLMSEPEEAATGGADRIFHGFALLTSANVHQWAISGPLRSASGTQMSVHGLLTSEHGPGMSVNICMWSINVHTGSANICSLLDQHRRWYKGPSI